METTQNSGTGKRLTYGPITVDKVTEGLNKDKKHQVQIRQIVTSVYPGVRTGNSLNDSLFGEEEFKLTPQSFDEKRVAFLPIPIGTTVETVAERLRTLPNARIIKILSLHPILTNEQRNAIQTGLTKREDGTPMTEADYAEKQAIIDQDKQRVLYKGHVQYRTTAFMDGKSGPIDDVDHREQDLFDMNPIHMTDVQAQATSVEEAKEKKF